MILTVAILSVSSSVALGDGPCPASKQNDNTHAKVVPGEAPLQQQQQQQDQSGTAKGDDA